MAMATQGAIQRAVKCVLMALDGWTQEPQQTKHVLAGPGCTEQL